MNVVVVDHYFDQDYRAALLARFPELVITAAKRFADVRHAIPGAQAVFALGHLFNDDWVAKARKLRWIQALTTGTDAIEALQTLGDDVIVTSARGIHAPQMSEMAFIHMLALAHKVPRMLANQQHATWERWPQSLLFKKKVVILGTGVIATGLARRCQAFEMQVTGVSATPRVAAGFDSIVSRSTLKETLADADFVVCLLPAGPQTDGYIDAAFIAAMKRSAYLVNMSRGSVVDEAALLAALRAGDIAGAGLDAFRTEPLPATHAFWQLDNIVISPKHGGTTDIYVEQVLPILTHNISCFLQGNAARMMNIVRAPAHCPAS